MAFGQPAGPPASHRQVQQLTALIHDAGHTDFRDARGPLGLNQRQAGGRFTRDEADALIARLELEAQELDSGILDAGVLDTGALDAGGADSRARVPAPDTPSRSFDRSRAQMINRLPEIPAEALAAELQRRGWVVMEP